MKSVALKVATIYVIVGSLWILLSDRLAVAISPTESILSDISIAKGWLYVVVTGWMLYALIVRYTAANEAAQRETRDSEIRFRSVFEGSPLGIVIFRDAKLLYANAALARMFGYASPEAIAAVPLAQLIAPRQRDAVRDRMQRRQRGETVVPVKEVYGLRADGVEFPIAAEVARIDLPDGPAIVAFVEDISERRELEARLLQAQKMEGIGRLAGGVAHDFNNLLTVILGHTDAAESARDEHARNASLAVVRQAALRAAALTRQLLAFARKQVTEPVVTDLNQLVSEIEQMLRRILGEDIDVVTMLDPNLAPVRIDPGHFGQVLVNLAVNARDAMPDGGKLTIETANVKLDEDYARLHADVTPGDYVLLAVTDTGAGLSEEARLHAFEPFFTTKQGGKGTGLGLATCFGIVKQAGGHIWIYSEEGRGASVKVYLPRAEGTPAPPQRATRARRPRGAETVLVVEDEELVRDIATTALRSHGYTVLEAASGDEALEIAAHHDGPIHLLMTDVVMPRMSGRQLADRLAETRPDTKVVFTSGYTDNAIVHQGVLDPNVAFIQKPYTLDILLQMVRKVLDGELPHGGAASLDLSAGV